MRGTCPRSMDAYDSRRFRHIFQAPRQAASPRTPFALIRRSLHAHHDILLLKPAGAAILAQRGSELPLPLIPNT
jgi:hypothetical protein